MSLVVTSGFTMMKLSLGLNSAILTPLTFSLWADPENEGHIQVFGPDTQARRILFAMYSSINVLSLAAMAKSVSAPEKAALLAVPLFGAQIVYKTITAFYNKGWTPVIYFNQFVTMVHLVTLYSMHKDGILDVFF